VHTFININSHEKRISLTSLCRGAHY